MTGRTFKTRRILVAALALAAAGAWSAGAGDAAEWHRTASPPLRVYSFRGYWYPVFQLDRAWALLGGVDESSRWSGPQVPTRFPATREAISRYHLIVAVDMDIASWPAGTLELCREYVRQGGAMLLFGGLHAFSTGYAGSPLEEISPVTFRAGDSLARVPEGMPLKPGPQARDIAAETLDWSGSPRTYRYHRVTPKPDALLIALAGPDAILVAGRYGKGRVAVFAGTVMGTHLQAQTPFWMWKEWPELMARTTRWLTATDGERATADTITSPAPEKRIPLPAVDASGDERDLEDMLTQIEQTPSLHSVPPGMNLYGSLLPAPDTVKRQTADRHQSRMEDLVRAGNAANPESIPLLRQVIEEHRRDRSRDPHEGQGRTESDALHDEALLAAVLCGDDTAVRPVVDLLLQLDFTVIGMFGRGWNERDLRKREQLHSAAQLIRAWSWQAAERLRNAPPAVLPALAGRIAEETDPWIVPLAHRLFGSAFRKEPLPAAAQTALRNSTLPAINELVTEGNIQ